MKRVAIITSSDTGYRGEREDLSGPAIREIVEKNGYEVVSEDVLPDDRKIPEAMRAYSMTITKRAMLSRSTAGIRKKTLIINLPGSPKAVKESLEYIIDALGHGIEIMTGEAGNCAR